MTDVMARLVALEAAGARPPPILVRIRVEEAELATALGQEYRSYASRTRRLVPGLW